MVTSQLRELFKLGVYKPLFLRYNTPIIFKNKELNMKTIKQLGLLDIDFLQGLALFIVPIIIKVVS